MFRYKYLIGEQGNYQVSLILELLSWKTNYIKFNACFTMSQFYSVTSKTNCKNKLKSLIHPHKENNSQMRYSFIHM